MLYVRVTIQYRRPQLRPARLHVIARLQSDLQIVTARKSLVFHVSQCLFLQARWNSRTQP